MTTDQATVKEAWRLVHEVRLPMKQTATRLGMAISEVYELLARERKRRDIAAHRAAALGLMTAPE